jgi:hypothetical protein
MAAGVRNGRQCLVIDLQQNPDADVVRQARIIGKIGNDQFATMEIVKVAWTCTV